MLDVRLTGYETLLLIVENLRITYATSLWDHAQAYV